MGVGAGGLFFYGRANTKKGGSGKSRRKRGGGGRYGGGCGESLDSLSKTPASPSALVCLRARACTWLAWASWAATRTPAAARPLPSGTGTPRSGQPGTTAPARPARPMTLPTAAPRSPPRPPSRPWRPRWPRLLTLSSRRAGPVTRPRHAACSRPAAPGGRGGRPRRGARGRGVPRPRRSARSPWESVASVRGVSLGGESLGASHWARVVGASQ